MSELIPAVKYRSCQGLACPRCLKERGEYVHLLVMLERRPDFHSEDGYSYAEKPVYVRSREKVFDDDVPIATNDDDFGTSSATGWMQRYTLQCSQCPTAFHRSQGVFHAFDDDELPLDYWADHEANLELMRRRGISQKVIDGHVRLLASLGLVKPVESDFSLRKPMDGH